jgi:hypothetical protein
LNERKLAETEIGQTDPITKPEVDLELTPSREIPIAGELWSIIGTMRNRSSQTIWIVDDKTWLMLAPEMWGLGTTRGRSQLAFFPTVRARPTSEIVRIDPNCEYSILWTLDPFDSEVKAGLLEIPRRIFGAIRAFAFFNPGRFTIAAVAHIWTSPPMIGDEGTIINTGASVVINTSRQLEMEASPWVVITGAVIGSALSHTLQILTGAPPTRALAAVGYITAPLLSAIVTILLSRLAATDFLISIKVKDIWGAIAIGFITQWIGTGVLNRILSGVSGSGQSEVLGATSGKCTVSALAQKINLWPGK